MPRAPACGSSEAMQLLKFAALAAIDACDIAG
jgi:hypothetical protein